MSYRRFSFLIIFLLFLFGVYSQDSSALKILFFHSLHCKACIYVKENVLPKLKSKYKNKIDIVYLETSKKENLSKLIALTKLYGKEEAYVPTVLCGGKLIVGRNNIERKLPLLIDYFLAKNKTSFSHSIFKKHNFNPSQKSLTFRSRDEYNFSLLGREPRPKGRGSTNLIEKKFSSFSSLAIIGGGLLDGINPCAFAVIVFFVSFLTCYGYKKRELIAIGSFYILAIFITYILIGLGLFSFLYSLRYFYLAMKIFYLSIALLCFVLASLCIYDYIKFLKTKEPKESVLQLPKFIKLKIHKLIGDKFRDREAGSRRFFFVLSLTALAVGFVVSLLEALCTGQIYLPVIALVLKVPYLRLRALFYLIIYNLMFILPLVIIFIFALWGVSSLKFSEFLKKRFGALRLSMAILFLGFGLFLLWSL